MTTSKRILLIVRNLILSGIILIILLLSLSFLPIAKNYLKIFIVQSGSMEPALKTGSLIFITHCNEYHVGDIVTRKTSNQNMTVTHRIVEKTENGKFITKGDANEDRDKGEIEKDNILGKVFLKIPFVGYLINYSKTFWGLIIFMIIPAGLIIFSELKKIKKEIRFKNSKENKIGLNKKNIQDK